MICMESAFEPFQRGEKLSRRQLLNMFWAKPDMILTIDRQQCTGCGLCAMDCKTEALTVLQSAEDGAYQLLFQHDLCNACGACETSCPEKCLTLGRAPAEGQKEECCVVFEDEITRCSECGVFLFPRAMVRHLKERTLAAGKMDIPFELCPECRIRKQMARGILN